MSIGRISAFLFASLAICNGAAAEQFVTQLRVPARGDAIDVIAWRDGDDIAVARGDLARLGIIAPVQDGPVRLSGISGLRFTEDASAASIIIECTAACFEPQRLGEAPAPASSVQRATGGYINYDLDTRWRDDGEWAFSALGEAVAFGRFGLIESSWIGADGDGLQRLETRWTLDFPERRLRFRVGDAVIADAGGDAVRYGGVQIGRAFALEPSFITYPTSLIAGEAASASTVELYVDGALRARDRVEAGPFVFDNAPLITGGGQAALVVTDVAGREQLITRPFFVSTALLRRGLTDWSLAAGAPREAFGRENARYGDGFLAGRYRVGLTNALTAEAVIDANASGAVTRLGATFASVGLGQVRVAHAAADDGGASEAGWFNDTDRFSFGAEAIVRDAGFRGFAPTRRDFLSSYAAHISVDLDAFGAASVTAASVDIADEPEARTVTISYTPTLEYGAFSVRMLYSERERGDLSIGVSYSLSFSDDISGAVGVEHEERGIAYRASAQRAAPPVGVGWRARAATGTRERFELAGLLRSRFGDTIAQAAGAEGSTSVRLAHTGSFGLIEDHRFAARRIDEAFALVDVGAPNVAVRRDHLALGVTDQDGRMIATGLRPYDRNAISIDADTLPINLSVADTEMQATAGDRAGIVVRFANTAEPLTETQAIFSNGAPLPRGAVLTRDRDGGRFPVGSDGRVVVRGAANGDELQWRACSASADASAVRQGLRFTCAAAP